MKEFRVYLFIFFWVVFLGGCVALIACALWTAVKKRMKRLQGNEDSQDGY